MINYVIKGTLKTNKKILLLIRSILCFLITLCQQNGQQSLRMNTEGSQKSIQRSMSKLQHWRDVSIQEMAIHSFHVQKIRILMETIIIMM